MNVQLMQTVSAAKDVLVYLSLEILSCVFLCILDDKQVPGLSLRTERKALRGTRLHFKVTLQDFIYSMALNWFQL